MREWKTVRVFISSTFRDTHVERDALTRLIFPELRNWCEQRYLHITEVDLRWGVTQEESAAGKAIDICLDEIDRSDVFLCLVGSRYGWIPEQYQVGKEERFDWVREQKGLSITELEIMRGALNPQVIRAQSVHSALFYFRDEEFLSEISDPTEKCEFTDGHAESKSGQLHYIPDENKRTKLKALKDRIIECSDRYNCGRGNGDDSDGVSIHVHDNYSSLYCGNEGLSRMNETKLREFCDMVLSDLKEAINARYPMELMQKTSKVDPAAAMHHHQSAFIHHRLDQFLGRDDEVQKVISYAFAPVVDGPLLVTAESGMGKSSILSKVVTDLEASLKIMDAEKQAKNVVEGPGDSSISKQRMQIGDTSSSSTQDEVKPTVLLHYFAGASPGSLQIINMLRFLLQQVRKHLKLLRPRKRADQLWSILRATLRLGKSTLSGTLEERDKKQPMTSNVARHMVTLDLPSNYADMVEDFKHSLVDICMFAKVILVIDNLDHLIRDKNHALMLRWLPSELPLSLRLIAGVDKSARSEMITNMTGKRDTWRKTFRRPTSPCSDSGVEYRSVKSATLARCRSANGRRQDNNRETSGVDMCLLADDPTKTRVEKFESQSFMESFQLRFKHCQVIEVPGITCELAEELIASTLDCYGKKLNKPQMKILLDKNGATNPTWVVIACEELRIFSKYEQVTERILELAEDLPSLLEQMITRLERDHGPAFVRDTLSILACSRDGLYEKEVVGILGVPLSAWSQLYYSLKPLLASSSRHGNGLISFSHRNFALAILKRYFSEGNMSFDELVRAQENSQIEQTSSYVVPIHARLALYFNSHCFDRKTESWNSENDRALYCLPYHMLHGKMYRSLESTLTDLQFIEAVFVAGSGFSWIDDIANALSVFEHLRLTQNVPVGPELGLDTRNSRVASMLSPDKGIALDTSSDFIAAGKNHASTAFLPSSRPGSNNSVVDNNPVSTTINHESQVSEEMLRRVRDYYTFAQTYTPELNANPYLVFQYASNLPDSNAASRSAERYWQRAAGSNKRRAYLKWVNKPQKAGPCLVTLSGHTGAVLSCDISRDEKRVVSSSVDCSIRVWIAQTGECPLVLDGHTDAVTCVTFSPVTNDVIVSGSRDGTARVWVKGVSVRVFTRHCDFGVKTGQKQPANGSGAPILSCAISECGSWVATGDQSGRLMIWDIFAEEEPLHDFHNFHGGITSICFSVTNEYIFAMGGDKTIRGWDLNDGQQYMCKSGEGMGLSPAFASDREKLLYCLRTSSMRIKVFDASCATKQLSEALRINPNSEIHEQFLTSHIRDKKEKNNVVEEKIEERLPELEIHQGEYREGEEGEELETLTEEAREYLAEQERLQSDDYDPNCPVRDWREFPRCTLVDGNAHLASCSSIASNNHVAMGRLNGSIGIFNGKTGKRTCVLHGHIARINHICYSHSGQVLVSASDDNVVKIWNPRRACLSSHMPHKASVKTCSFNQQSRVLSLLSMSHEGHVSLWNANNGYRTSLTAVHDPLRDARFAKNGQCYITVASRVRIFSCSSDDKSWIVPQKNVGIWDLSPCGKIFCCAEVGSSDVIVWSIHSNPIKKVRVITAAHSKKITCLEFSKDGGLLYTAGNDGKIKAWDTLKITQEILNSRQMFLASSGLKKQMQSDKNISVQSGHSPVHQSEASTSMLLPLLELYDLKGLGLASLIHNIYESPTGLAMLSVSDSPEIKYWNLEHSLQEHLNVDSGGQTATSVNGHANRVVCAAWAPHGQQFASGCAKGTIRLWDSTTLFCSTIIRGHSSAIVDVQYMPDGRRMASISNDKSLCVWNVASGEQINSMIFEAPLTCLALSSTGRFLAVGDKKGDMRILEAMNPYLGLEAEAVTKMKGDDQIQEATAFETEEFPFVIPHKMLHITVKGSKKWDVRCQIECPYCTYTFSLSGNMMKLVLKAERDANIDGVTKQYLVNILMLNRCIQCRRVIRIAPFRCDRSNMLSKVQWQERVGNNRKKNIKWLLNKSELLTLQNYSALHNNKLANTSFYNPNMNEKMAPFHRKEQNKLPKLSVSRKKDGGEGKGSAHDLMGKHLHALSLKAQSSASYKTFQAKNLGGNSNNNTQEQDFVQLLRSKQIKKDKTASHTLPDSSHVKRNRSPQWLSAFSEMESASLEQSSSTIQINDTHNNKSEGNCRLGVKAIHSIVSSNSKHSKLPLPKVNKSKVGFYRSLNNTKHTSSTATITAYDEKFLEREGHLIRRCKTASGGGRHDNRSSYKVLRSTTDLLSPENMFRIVHGLDTVSMQLEAVQKINPFTLQILPQYIDFGVLCEHSVYRHPVQLLNKSATLMRFRVAVELQDDQQDCHHRQGQYKNPPIHVDGPGLLHEYDSMSSELTTISRDEKNIVNVIVPSGSKKIVHGLKSTIFVEVHTVRPGTINGMLRISTDKCQLFSTPIHAMVASKADFASSLQRARAAGEPDITNRNVCHIDTALNNVNMLR